MGKKEREEHHKDKSRKKHKHHKSSKHRTAEIEISLQTQEIPQIVEEEVEIDVDYHQSGINSPSNLIQISESIIYDEEIVDIEVEEVTLDYSMESSKMEEEPEPEQELEHEQEQDQDQGQEHEQVIERVERVKKPNKKIEIVQTPPSKAPTPNPNTNPKKSKKRRDSGTSSEEERWLVAIESGKLEEVEDIELRKMKDPKLMTARQRAMYDRNNETESAPGFTETLIALPTGYKEKEKPQTVEEIQKAALKTLKRKQQADEKREKDKKKTMDRLLKKQDSKNRSSAKPRTAKETTPVISYKNTVDGGFVQLPVGVEFPLQPQAPKEPPPRQLCGIQGCGQPKVYNCSKTNLPLCSFACYRKNVQSLKEIIC